MRKLILGIVGIAMLAIPSIASADVTRCEASVTTGTTITTATFTALQPKDTTGQFTNVWKHDYTVIVNSNGSFSGTGTVTANGVSFGWEESITGSFNTDKSAVSFDTVPVGGGSTFKVTNAPMNNITVPVESTWTANEIEFQISPPVVTTATTTTPGTESVKNHGQFVKAQGGGKLAAQACAGMPLNSTQGS